MLQKPPGNSLILHIGAHPESGKLRRRLQEKRMALGHKRDDHEDEQLHHVNDNTM